MTLGPLRWRDAPHRAFRTTCGFCTRVFQDADRVVAILTRGLRSVPVHETCLQDPGCLASVGGQSGVRDKLVDAGATEK